MTKILYKTGKPKLLKIQTVNSASQLELIQGHVCFSQIFEEYTIQIDGIQITRVGPISIDARVLALPMLML